MGSKTNTRRLKRVYRCEVCVKTFRNFQTLNFHKKTHYKNASKEMRSKKQTGTVSVPAKQADHVFTKPEAKIAPVPSTYEHGKKLMENSSRKIEFTCPKCDKSFNVYFSAFRHVQKYHCVDSKGNPVNPNSPNLIKPIRREQCSRCNKAIKATEFHTCAVAPGQDNLGRPAETYMCIGCAQTFSGVKTFDLHVAGVHNVHVQSLFFPNNYDFTDWKVRVEKQANCTYALMSSYSSKDIYRCTYSPINDNSGNLHICPSSFIHQKFTKGVQVHFYPDHFGHPSTTYIPTLQDKQFCIKYLLEKAEGYQDIADMKLDSADAYIEFKNLMEHIVLEAAKLDMKSLKKFMGKALEMSSNLKEYDEDADVPEYTFDNKLNQQSADKQSDKQITDEQIHNELQASSVRTSNRIRRKSTPISTPDFLHEPQNKKLKTNPLSENVNTPKKINHVNFVDDKPEILHENEPLAQLRIVETFSLNAACTPQSSKILGLNGNKKENINTVGHKPNEVISPAAPSVIKATNETKSNTKNVKDPPKVRFPVSQSQSFNDSYKEFVDKNFKASDKPAKPKKQVMKTKIGQFIPNSPRRKSMSSPTATPPTPPNPFAPRTYVNTKKLNKTLPNNVPKIETKPVSESESTPKSKSVSKSVTESSISNGTKLNHKNDTKPALKDETDVTPKTYTKSNRKGHKKQSHKREESSKSLKHKSEEKSLPKSEEKSLPKSEKKLVDKNEEKSNHKNELKSTPKNGKKSLDSDAKKPRKTKLLLNKSLDIKYEVKEQENDCNILVLKI